MNSRKSQINNISETTRSGNFNVGEEIKGKFTLIPTSPIVNASNPGRPVESRKNPPISFTGKVTRVTDAGAITEIICETTNGTIQEERLPTLINLENQCESYEIYSI